LVFFLKVSREMQPSSLVPFLPARVIEISTRVDEDKCVRHAVSCRLRTLSHRCVRARAHAESFRIIRMSELRQRSVDGSFLLCLCWLPCSRISNSNRHRTRRLSAAKFRTRIYLEGTHRYAAITIAFTRVVRVSAIFLSRHRETAESAI
jgi:hypothetical protein